MIKVDLKVELESMVFRINQFVSEYLDEQKEDLKNKVAAATKEFDWEQCIWQEVRLQVRSLIKRKVESIVYDAVSLKANKKEIQELISKQVVEELSNE